MAAASIAVVVPARRGRRSRWANKCTTCDGVDASEWVLNACTKLYPSPAAVDEAPPRRLRRAKDKAGQVWDGTGARRLEELFRELFRLHDLNGNGLLEEQELIKLNEKIALLHYGKDADTSDVRAKYRAVFRAKLDPEGRPVAYEIFRAYAREVVDGLDTDPEAQEMILEQFVAEAQSGREAFDVPSLVNESDLPFMPNKSVAEIFSKRVPRSSHDEAERTQERDSALAANCPHHWRLSVMGEIPMLPGLSPAGTDAKNLFGRVALDVDELESLQGLLDASVRKVYTRDRRGGKVPDRLEVKHGFRIQNMQNWLEFTEMQHKIRLGIEALKTGGTAGVCAQGHELQPLGTTRDNGWGCDGRKDPDGCCSGITGFRQTKGMNRFRCQHCDFDYCEKCYLMRTGSKLCPKGHPLVPLGTSRDNGWGCDARRTPSGCLRGNKTKGVNRFRCKECDFDLCDRCFQMHVGHVNNSVADLKTAGADLLGPPLDEESNTVWLFHGTNDEAAEGITRGDFLLDNAGSNAGTLYGRGIYLAESCSKADEYTVENGDGLRCMLLCRATLGNVLYSDEKSPNVDSLVRQCKRGTFNSVLGDREKARGTYREFVVYDDDQVYPEISMWYKRVYQPAPE